MLKEQLKRRFEEAVRAAYPDQSGIDVVVEYPADPDHGDYASPVALQLSKKVGSPPREVAEAVVAALDRSDIVHAVDIAGPGFINVFITPAYLVGEVRAVLATGDRYGRNTRLQGEKVTIEYSSPNTNKPLHLGHARNNFLGMAVANLMEANGAEVTKAQIINDRGIHICKSMVAYQKWGRDTSPEGLGKKGDHFVGDYYVKYAAEEKENPALAEETKAMLKGWEGKDPDVRALWEKMNAWALAGFNETYEKIGSRFDEVTFESDISEGGRALVEKALSEGKAERIEGGALAVDLSDCGLGDSETGKKVLVRSDGTTVYMTQDLQLAVNRMEGTAVDRLIYVVGNEQDYHFKALFEVLKRFGYDWAKRLTHLSYGMVMLPSGKMKSREGTTVDIDALVEELETLAEKELASRDMPYEGEERRHLVRVIALGALKYYILKVDAKSEMLYDPAASIDFQGNTGPYLQYTTARIRSILRRTPESETLLNVAVDPAVFIEPDEWTLLRKLPRYSEAVAVAADARPSLLANELFALAQAFNVFYGNHRVLEAPTPELRAARLQLSAAVAQVLKNGLDLLGIEAPERM